MNGYEWSIVAWNLNAKDPFWNSPLSNTTGNILYHHAQQYSIISPNSPTYFSSTPSHRPDVLDISLTKQQNLLQQTTKIYNLNELSSNHNLILLNNNDSPITSSPLQKALNINWKKFTTIPSRKICHSNPSKTKQEIDKTDLHLTRSIQSETQESAFIKSQQQNYQNISHEILQEIIFKNYLCRDWQRNHNPAVKRQLNNKIKFILKMLTHNQNKWDMFLDSIDQDENLIYKLNKNLLRNFLYLIH